MIFEISGITDDIKNGEKLLSDIKMSLGLKWRIDLYPYGTEKFKNKVSIFVRCINNITQIFDCSLILHNSLSDTKIIKMNGDLEFSLDLSRGYGNVMDSHIFLNLENGYIIDQTATIKC